MKVPKSEKNNSKHFSFVGTPLRNQTNKLSDLERKTDLPSKPGTSVSANSSFRKDKFKQGLQSVGKKGNFMNLEISNFDDSSTLLDDSGMQLFLADRESIKFSKSRVESDHRSPHQILSEIEKENEIQRLKEEIKKLHVNLFFNIERIEKRY